MVTESAKDGYYDILAGNVRFEACKRLGWKSVPVVIQGSRSAGNGGGAAGP